MSNKSATPDQQPVQTSHQPDLWTWFVAAFLCYPAHYAAMVAPAHWIRHSRLVMFSTFVVLPISGFSWAHITMLLIGPSEGAMSIMAVSGLFAMCVVGLMDSMLCGALGQSRFTLATFAVFCFRWVFAICAATCLAMGATLYIMQDQLNRERTDQELIMQAADRERIRSIHDLGSHEASVTDAKSNLAQAQIFLATIPPEVASLKSSYEACQIQLKDIETANTHTLPPLVGERVKLRSEIQRADAAGESSLALSDIKGKLREVESEIGQLRQRVRLKESECTSLKQSAAAALAEHKKTAKQAVDETTLHQKEVVKDATAASTAASEQLNGLNMVTKQTWSRNLSAQVKAAWSLVIKDGWATFVALMVFTICLVVELSPMLGKVALKGGNLDQLSAVDEEAAHQRLLTRMEAVRNQEEAERSVSLGNMMAIAEINATRRVADAVFDNVEQLHNSKERMQKYPDAKDWVDAVYRTARDKIRDQYMNAARSAC